MFKKVAARRCEARRIKVLIGQRILGIVLVRRIAENGRNREVAPRRAQLTAKLLIVRHAGGNRRDGKHRVKAEHTLTLQRIRLAPHRLLVEMREDILRHLTNALRRSERLFPINRAHLLVVDRLLALDRIDVVDAERQDIPVIDRIHNRIGVQLVPEELRRCPRRGTPRTCRIRRKDRRPRKAEDVVLLERLGDRRVHLTELRAVALIENQHHMLAIDRVRPVLADKIRQLLDRRHHNACAIVRKLAREHCRRCIAVRRALLEAVVLLHRLVVEILAVDHEEHLLDLRHRRGELRRLERGQRLARARRVPDIAAALDAPPRLVVRRNLDPGENPLRRRDLIRAHDHQHFFRRENAVARQECEQRVTCEERPPEIHQIGDETVARIRPVGCELKAVARLFARPAPSRIHLTDMALARRIGIVLRIRPVRDHKNLDVLIEPCARPERIPLIAFDLVKRLTDLHAAPFQLQMHERQPVHEDRHIVAIRMCRRILPRPCTALHRILMDHLQAVVVDIVLVDQTDILRRAIVTSQVLYIVRLDTARLRCDTVTRGCDGRFEEPFPLRICKVIAIQRRELRAEIGDQLRLIVNGEIRIALLLQQTDERPLQCRLRLVRAVRRTLLPHILCEYRTLLRTRDEIVVHDVPRFFLCGCAPETPRTHLSKILYKKIILRYSVDNFSPMPLPSHG